MANSDINGLKFINYFYVRLWLSMQLKTVDDQRLPIKYERIPVESEFKLFKPDVSPQAIDPELLDLEESLSRKSN